MGNQIQWTGRVTSGQGVAARLTAPDWFRASVNRFFGFEPAPGTLNVLIEGDRRELDRLLLTASTVLVPPARDVCCALLVPVCITREPNSVHAVLLRPIIYGYNVAQLELLAPVLLREALRLQDGDEVTITAEDAAPRQKWVAPPGADAAGPSSPYNLDSTPR